MNACLLACMHVAAEWTDLNSLATNLTNRFFRPQNYCFFCKWNISFMAFVELSVLTFSTDDSVSGVFFVYRLIEMKWAYAVWLAPRRINTSWTKKISRKHRVDAETCWDYGMCISTCVNGFSLYQQWICLVVMCILSQMVEENVLGFLFLLFFCEICWWEM